MEVQLQSSQVMQLCGDLTGSYSLVQTRVSYTAYGSGIWVLNTTIGVQRRRKNKFPACVETKTINAVEHTVEISGRTVGEVKGTKLNKLSGD